MRIAVYDQITFVANGGDATVAELYQSTFGRTPDLPGLEAWQHQLDTGAMTLAQISQAFAGCGEFQSRYGTNTTDTQFVDALYTNVLGRGADKGGEAAWVTYLGQQTTASGAAAARATVLQDFAGCPEEATNAASWLASPPSFSITPANPTANENAGSETFTITRSGDTSQAVTVYISAADGSTVSGKASIPAIFAALSYQPVTIAAGAATATVGVTINDLGVTSGASKNFGLQVTDGASNMAKALASDAFTIVDTENSAAHSVKVDGSVGPLEANDFYSFTLSSPFDGQFAFGRGDEWRLFQFAERVWHTYERCERIDRIRRVEYPKPGGRNILCRCVSRFFLLDWV